MNLNKYKCIKVYEYFLLTMNLLDHLFTESYTDNVAYLYPYLIHGYILGVIAYYHCSVSKMHIRSFKWWLVESANMNT